MAKCSHRQGFQLIEVESKISQDLQKLDSSNIHLCFHLMGRARCLGCGHIIRQKLDWNMNIELGLKIYPQFQSDGFDDGEDPEDSYA